MSKVVFCEDDPMIRKLVETALRSSTHDVHIAGDGKQGLDLITRLRPDVVFSDVEMPEVAGFQPCTMAALRARLAQHRKS